MNKWTLCLVAVAAIQFQSLAWSQEVPFHQKSTIVFASKELGQKTLAKSDVFVDSMSRFDLMSRLKKEGKLTKEHYFAFIKNHVRDWDKKDVEKLTIAIQSAKEKMAEYQLPFPQKILLIKTDGKDEGGAAYCRGPAVILPLNMTESMQPRAMESLLTHELFHVLSNQNPELRKKLYKIIGFKQCGEIRLPDSIVDKKITNPDGPTIDYYVDLKIEDKTVSAVPLLFAKSDYDLKKGGSFFSYLQFQLMAVEKGDKGWRSKLVDGEPVFYSPAKTESYFDNIGKNTGYIIHPDEVLADNFVYMVQKKNNLMTPRIVEEMKKVLSK